MLAQFSIEFLDEGHIEKTVGITSGEDIVDATRHIVDWYGDNISDLRIQPLEEVVDGFEMESLNSLLKFDSE